MSFYFRELKKNYIFACKDFYKFLIPISSTAMHHFHIINISSENIFIIYAIY